MREEDIDVIKVDHWECPKENGVAILTMPNVPKALHGPGCQPRTIYGKTVWEFMRKGCYLKADYKSEVSGIEPPKGQLHAHELFSYDYLKQEGVFVRCVALAKIEHDFIHSGRLYTLFRRNNPLVPKSYLLKVVENGFTIISSYNKAHPDEEPLRCFDTFIDYLHDPDLHDEMLALIEKYDIKFYGVVIPKKKEWRGWHVIVGDKRYDSPYKCQADWEEAMRATDPTDKLRSIKNPFQGGVYDVLNDMINGKTETKLAGCKNGRVSKRKEN